MVEKLKKLRTIVNELEEDLNEKKRNLKYEIMLDNDMINIKQLEVLDPANVDIDIIDKVGIQLPNEDGLALKHLRVSSTTPRSVTKSIAGT